MDLFCCFRVCKKKIRKDKPSTTPSKQVDVKATLEEVKTLEPSTENNIHKVDVPDVSAKSDAPDAIAVEINNDRLNNNKTNQQITKDINIDNIESDADGTHQAISITKLNFLIEKCIETKLRTHQENNIINNNFLNKETTSTSRVLENISYDFNKTYFQLNFERLTEFLQPNDQFVSYTLVASPVHDINDASSIDDEDGGFQMPPHGELDVAKVKQSINDTSGVPISQITSSDSNVNFNLAKCQDIIKGVSVEPACPPTSQLKSKTDAGLKNQSKSENFLQIFSIEKVYTRGYIINGKVHIDQRSWNCMTGKKMAMFCEACRVNVPINHKTGHYSNTKHVSKLAECKPLAEFGLAVVRQVETDRYHCAVCNWTFSVDEVRVHAATEKHISALDDARKTATQLLDDDRTRVKDLLPPPLDGRAAPDTASEAAPQERDIKTTALDKASGAGTPKDKYLKVHLLKVKSGGFVVNGALALPTRNYNALTGTCTKMRCAACGADTGYGQQHYLARAHRDNLARCPFLAEFHDDFIRELWSGSYHCAVCNSLSEAPAAHAATPAHRAARGKLQAKALRILKDSSNYFPFKQ